MYQKQVNIDSKQMKVYLRCRRQDETRCTFRAMEATEQLHVHVHPYWSRAVILTDINQICGVRQSCKGTEQLKTSHISCVNNVIDLNQLSLLSWLRKWSCHDFQGNFGHPNKRSNLIFIGPHKTVGLRPPRHLCLPRPAALGWCYYKTYTHYIYMYIYPFAWFDIFCFVMLFDMTTWHLLLCSHSSRPLTWQLGHCIFREPPKDPQSPPRNRPRANKARLEFTMATRETVFFRCK